MKLIICGAGQVGWQIAKHLSSENNDITVIDKDIELVRRLTNSLDVAGVTGLASHPNVLDRAGAKDADMIIAVTRSDEVNMVVCQVAHSVFSIPRRIHELENNRTFLLIILTYIVPNICLLILLFPQKKKWQKLLLKD